MNFWDELENGTKELEAEVTKQKADIVAAAKEKNRLQEEAWERMSKYTVRATKCYLVQVLDEAGNEVKCEYVFSNTKKEAEERGYQLREEVAEYEDSGQS